MLTISADQLVMTTGTDTSDPECTITGSRSRQELLAIAMPFVLVAGVLVILLMFSYDRTLSFLLYSSLTAEYKTRAGFRLLLPAEVLFVVMLASNGGLVLNTQLLFFEKLSGHLKRLKRASFM